MTAPFVLMIAGPNGSGKTTLTDELRRRGVDFGVYINADDIARDLQGDYGARVRQAQVEAERRRRECLSSGTSFSFETVMSHPSKVALFAEAKRAGFTTLLYFVATDDPALNVARVRQRVALGGHAVPEDRIVARYARTMALLPGAMEAADRLVLFDNTRRVSVNGPVILRPFLVGSRTPPASVKIEGPVPGWGRVPVALSQAWLGS